MVDIVENRKQHEMCKEPQSPPISQSVLPATSPPIPPTPHIQWTQHSRPINLGEGQSELSP